MKRFFFIFGIFLSISACRAERGEEADRYYYEAIREKKSGNTEKSVRLFKKAATLASPLCAARSLEALMAVGDVGESLSACKELLNKDVEESSFLAALNELNNQKEFALVISATEKTEIDNVNAEIGRLRLLALREKKDSRLLAESLKWYLSSKISSSHVKYFPLIEADYESFIGEKKDEEKGEDEKEIPLIKLLYTVSSFRVKLYSRQYESAYENMQKLLEMRIENKRLLSDMGKAAFYGSRNFLKNAAFFRSLSDKATNKTGEFYTSFYTARLYERAEGNYGQTVIKYYKKAVEAAPLEENADNAIWYLLMFYMSRSVDEFLEKLNEYAAVWHDGAYFDDLLDMITPILLTESRYKDIKELYDSSALFFSPAARAKISYLYARLIEESFIKGKKDEIISALLTAATSPFSYYKVMAMVKLDYSKEKIIKEILKDGGKTNEEEDAEASRFLLGLSKAGLPERIYTEWQRLKKERKLSRDAEMKSAAFLHECGKKEPAFFTESLRICAASASKSGVNNAYELKLLFPKCYTAYVEKTASRYNVPESFCYALIRSESFFDAEAVSSAGAKGLTQLMEFTAADIALKLKRTEYSLTDPEANIEFGFSYLASLRERLDGNYLHAFFAYNAGITRVRRWIKNTKINLPKGQALQDDLFLETLPYAETREYGRKLILSSILYGALYYDKEANEILEFISNSKGKK